MVVQLLDLSAVGTSTQENNNARPAVAERRVSRVAQAIGSQLNIKSRAPGEVIPPQRAFENSCDDRSRGVCGYDRALRSRRDFD